MSAIITVKQSSYVHVLIVYIIQYHSQIMNLWSDVATACRYSHMKLEESVLHWYQNHITFSSVMNDNSLRILTMVNRRLIIWITSSPKVGTNETGCFYYQWCRCQRINTNYWLSGFFPFICRFQCKYILFTFSLSITPFYK
jgi:hypothetical protein